MSDIRQKLVKLAMAQPAGSEKQKKLFKILAASYEDYTTDEGTPFRIRSTDFADFLQKVMGLRPGPEMGKYLREEEQVPDRFRRKLREYGAKVRVAPARREKTYEEVLESLERGPDINRLWDNLVKAIWAQYKRPGDVADFYLMMPKNYEDEDLVNRYLPGVAGDLSLNWRYDLSPRAEKWLDKLELALQTGIYKGYRPDFLRDKRQMEEVIGSIYADAWHDSMIRGWERVKKNPKEMARLKAVRASSR